MNKHGRTTFERHETGVCIVIAVFLIWVGVLGTSFSHEWERNEAFLRHYDDYHVEGTPCHVHIYVDGERFEWDVAPESNISVNVNPPWLENHLNAGHQHNSHDGNAGEHTHGGQHAHDNYGVHRHAEWSHTHKDKVIDDPIMSPDDPIINPIDTEITDNASNVSFVETCLPEELVIGELEIISVFEKRHPRRLIVKLRNNSDRFISLSLCYKIELFDADGNLKVDSMFGFSGKNLYITPQKSVKEAYADTYFYLLPKRNFDKLDYKSDEDLLGERPVFALSFQYYYGSQQPGYQEGDVIVLLYEGKGDAAAEEVSRFPKQVVPMSPRMHRTLTTNWAAMKE